MSRNYELFVEAGIVYFRSAPDPKIALGNVMRSAVSAVGSDCASLFLLHEFESVLHPHILVNLDASLWSACRAVPLGTECCGRAVLHELPWVIEDVWSDPLLSDPFREALKNVGIRSLFSVPVVPPSKHCIAALGFHFKQRTVPPDYLIDLATVFAEVVAFGLEQECAFRKVASLAELLRLQPEPICLKSDQADSASTGT